MASKHKANTAAVALPSVLQMSGSDGSETRKAAMTMSRRRFAVTAASFVAISAIRTWVLPQVLRHSAAPTGFHDT
jgi:hypothetical protein